MWRGTIVGPWDVGVDGRHGSQLLQLTRQRFAVAWARTGRTFSFGLRTASGVSGDTTVFSELSVGECGSEPPSLSFLKPDGA